MSDLTTLSVAELCDRLTTVSYRILDAERPGGKEIREAARRLDALRWRPASERPDSNRDVIVACGNPNNPTYHVDWYSPKQGWSFQVFAWCELPAYEPEREVRGK